MDPKVEIERALRMEPPDVWHHVTARGNERKNIFPTDRDRSHFKDLLAEGVERFGLLLHAWVLMSPFCVIALLAEWLLRRRVKPNARMTTLSCVSG